MPPDIRHVIVLMLENRSFDHMLGAMDHPDPTFVGLGDAPTSIRWREGEDALITPDGMPGIDPGPDHGHLGVMWQLTGREQATYVAPYDITCDGFAEQFEAFASMEGKGAGHGDRVVKCLPALAVPTLTTLAREFAVFDHWHCSVPGETWPNRNFAHAGTADGEVDIVLRLYHNRTIFEQIAEAGGTWGIYHDGPPQAWAFPKLWDLPWRNRFHDMDSLFGAIRKGKLPHYSFVEPAHFFGGSNSQHPGNNARSPRDFHAGERLVSEIYDALVGNPVLFERTLFLVTYDEHGGYFDHVPPAQDERYRDGTTHGSGFAFDLLGPRVPAVLVSPFIRPASIDHRVFEHSSIVATLRTLFARDAEPLGRSGSANRFVDPSEQSEFWLDAPRRLRKMSELLAPAALMATSAAAVAATPPGSLESGRVGLDSETETGTLDAFQESLVWLTEVMDRAITEEEITGKRPEVQDGQFVVPAPAALRTTAAIRAPLAEYVRRVTERFRESVR